MKEKLMNLLDNAYTPYYNYPVSCVLVTKDNEEFYGVNVENASPGISVCAEISAITSAITKGYKKGDFAKIYIMSAYGEFLTPCFLCRQVLVEFFDKDALVISINGSGEEKTYQVSELCPHPFNESDLK